MSDLNVPSSESLSPTIFCNVVISRSLIFNESRCWRSSSILVDFLMESPVTFSCCSLSLTIISSLAVTSPHCFIAPFSASVAAALDMLRSRSICSYFFFSSVSNPCKSATLCSKPSSLSCNSSNWLLSRRRFRLYRLFSSSSSSALVSSCSLYREMSNCAILSFSIRSAITFSFLMEWDSCLSRKSAISLSFQTIKSLSLVFLITRPSLWTTLCCLITF